MKLQFGQTQELVNSQFAPVAALARYYQAEAVLQPLEQVVARVTKSSYSLPNQLTQVLLSILTGCPYLSVVNTRLRPEGALAQLYRIERFAHQGTLARSLDALTQTNLTQLEQAVQQIGQACSRTRQHDWRGFLQLDFDLSGLPCGKQAEGSQLGYFSGKKTSRGANWLASAPLPTTKRSGPACLRAIGTRSPASSRLCGRWKLHLS